MATDQLHAAYEEHKAGTEPALRHRSRIADLLGMRSQQRSVLTMVAPMVRCSMLPFRLLCRRWGADIAYTPMILCDSFNRSESARDCEFQTCEEDRPLIVQFATNSPEELALAVEKCNGYVQGIDLNCGCPQPWVLKERIGASLLSKPQLIRDLVVAAKACSKVPFSVKIRVNKDIRKTIDLVRHVESAGVAWITVHGRTIAQRIEPVDLDAIKLVRSAASVPIVANGDIFTLADCERVAKYTGADGVMSARGLIANPALFSGANIVPSKCVSEYIQLASDYGGPFGIHHHHLANMLTGWLTRAERTDFASARTMDAMQHFLRKRGFWRGELPCQALAAAASSEGVSHVVSTAETKGTSPGSGNVGGTPTNGVVAANSLSVAVSPEAKTHRSGERELTQPPLAHPLARCQGSSNSPSRNTADHIKDSGSHVRARLPIIRIKTLDPELDARLAAMVHARAHPATPVEDIMSDVGGALWN